MRDPGTFLYNIGPVLTIDSANLNVRQFYTVNRIAGARRSGTVTTMGSNFQVAPANIGPKSTPDYPSLANAAASLFASASTNAVSIRFSSCLSSARTGSTASRERARRSFMRSN